jgi:hypothetical protein
MMTVNRLISGRREYNRSILCCCISDDGCIIARFTEPEQILVILIDMLFRK